MNIDGDGGVWHITTPKTKSSIRIIPMPKVLIRDLCDLYRQESQDNNFDSGWFIAGSDVPIHPDILRRRKNANAKKAGLKQIRIHDFRHSCASILINNGANIMIVAKYLGHTKIDETLNTYAHLFKNKMDDIVNLMDNLEKNM